MGSEKREKYDVLIAGLGPAGTALFWHLARRGFRVAAFDWRSEDRLWGKPCGDAIGAHHFSNAGLPLPGSAAKNVIRAVDIYSPGEAVRYRVRGEGYIIDRNMYGRILLREAIDRGGEAYLETPVIGPILSKGRVAGLIVRTGEGTKEYYASVVVEATGFSRVVKSKLPPDWAVSEPIDMRDVNIAYREIIAYEDFEVDEPDVIRIYLDQEVAPGGYWWYFPESKNTVNAGLGVQGGVGNPPPDRLYREVLTAKHHLFKHRYRVLNSAGAPVPTRRPADTLVGPSILVVGDAGYTVNPVHGGGMGYGFYAAYLAARAFEEAYDVGDFSEKGLWRLNIDYMRGLGAKQAALDVFRRFLQKLSNDDIRFGMEKRLIPEVDVYEVSSTGELKISVVEKAMIVLRGLRRPSLLAKLKTVADYMSRIRALYREYPETPAGLTAWRLKVRELLESFEEAVLGR